MRILILMFLPAMVGLSAPTDLATERRAAIIATNAANAVVAPVSNLAANAQSLALDALARPVGVSSGYVASVVSTARVSRVESADTSGAYNQFSGSAIYQTTITPAIPQGGFTFSAGFSANGVPPPLNLISGIPNGGWAVYRSPVSPFGFTLKYGTCEWGPATAATAANGHAVLVFASNGTHGEVGIATNWISAVAAVTNIVIYRLSETNAETLVSNHNGEASAHNGRITALESRPIGISTNSDGTLRITPSGGPSGFYVGETNLQTLLDERLSIDHENESSAHNGRLTALESRPAGITTNDVLPWITLADNYSTNGAIRVVVSNRIFSIWGLK